MKIRCLFFLFIPVFIQAQSNYYVSPTGNNGNNGSLAFPWLTVQFGLNQLSANDTLNVFTGVYHEKITIPVNSICLRRYQNDTPVIDALGIINQIPIIAINNKSGITIDGLKLRNNIQTDAQGILIDGYGSAITIKNCKIHDIHFSSNVSDPVNASTNAQGIIVYGNNATVSIEQLKIVNNELYDCRLGYSEGIAVNGNVDGFEISGNSVYQLTNIGIDIIGHEGTCSNPLNDQARNGLVKNNSIHDCLSPYATSGGIYIDGGKSVVVENNTSYHNGYGIEVGCENVGKTTDEISIRNNVFYDNEVAALALGGFDFPNGSGKVTNASFRNNTCFMNDFSNSGNGELYLSYSENSILENNIFYLSTQNNLAYSEFGQPSIMFDYNLFYSNGGESNMTIDWNGNAFNSFAAFQSGTGLNTHTAFSDPLFVAPSVLAPNFHLTSASPAIGSGNPNFIPALTEVDMDGESRANGNVDCGADEFYTTTGLTAEISTENVLIYPNPFINYVEVESFVKPFNELKLFSSTGQLILEKEDVNATCFILNLELLDPGIYSLVIDNTVFRKLIKY